MALGFMAHSPGGQPAFKTAAFQPVYKGSNLPDSPAPPATAGNYWAWRYAYAIFFNNGLVMWQNVSWDNTLQEYIREYYRYDYEAAKPLFESGLVSENTVNQKYFGTWADSQSPAKIINIGMGDFHLDHFRFSMDILTVPPNQEGTFTARYIAQANSSYPSEFAEIGRTEIPTAGLEGFVIVPVGASYENGSAPPITVTGWFGLQRYRY